MLNLLSIDELVVIMNYLEYKDVVHLSAVSQKLNGMVRFNVPSLRSQTTIRVAHSDLLTWLKRTVITNLYELINIHLIGNVKEIALSPLNCPDLIFSLDGQENDYLEDIGLLFSSFTRRIREHPEWNITLETQSGTTMIGYQDGILVIDYEAILDRTWKVKLLGGSVIQLHDPHFNLHELKEAVELVRSIEVLHLEAFKDFKGAFLFPDKPGEGNKLKAVSVDAHLILSEDYPEIKRDLKMIAEFSADLSIVIDMSWYTDDKINLKKLNKFKANYKAYKLDYIWRMKNRDYTTEELEMKLQLEEEKATQIALEKSEMK